MEFIKRDALNIGELKMEKKDDIQGFYNYLKKTKGLSDLTCYQYMIYHKIFLKDYDKLTQKCIDKFLQDKKNNSVCRGYIMAFLEFLKLDMKFRLPPAPSGTKKKKMVDIVSRDEFEKMRNKAYSSNKKHGIMLDLLYFGALRRFETLSIRVNSFEWSNWFEDMNEFCVFRVTGKGTKDRNVLVHPKAPKTIMELLLKKGYLTKHMGRESIIEKLNRSSDPLFKKISERIVYRVVKRYSLRALGRKIRPHMLRHARSTELEKNGASIRDIQKYLGHSNIATTEIYLHTAEEEALKRISKISSSNEKPKK